MFEKGDIVQIIDEKHAWFPCLLIVDEVKAWGVQAYALTPKSNDGSAKVAMAFNRVTTEQVEKVGSAVVLME
jgi:hypothetical protein